MTAACPSGGYLPSPCREKMDRDKVILLLEWSLSIPLVPLCSLSPSLSPALVAYWGQFSTCLHKWRWPGGVTSVRSAEAAKERLTAAQTWHPFQGEEMRRAGPQTEGGCPSDLYWSRARTVSRFPSSHASRACNPKSTVSLLYVLVDVLTLFLSFLLRFLGLLAFIQIEQ